MRNRFVASVALTLLSAATAVPFFGSAPAAAEPAPGEPAYHRIVFPVQEKVSYSDDFGAPRPDLGGGRSHEGNDLMGQKLFHEVAVVDGTITSVKVADGTGISGNMLTLKGNDGWFYYYIHVNNDTPGTDDGANPAEYRFASGIEKGTKVNAGEFIAYMGDSGDAESTGPHLDFEVHQPDGTAIDPYASLRLVQGPRSGAVGGVRPGLLAAGQ